jgi:hypothetical protein
MKKYVALVFIIVGGALVIDTLFGLLAGGHGSPVASLLIPLILIMVGIQWRRA